MLKYVLPLVILLASCGREEITHAYQNVKYKKGEWACLVSDPTMKVRIVGHWYANASMTYYIKGVATQMKWADAKVEELQDCIEKGNENEENNTSTSTNSTPNRLY